MVLLDRGNFKNMNIPGLIIFVTFSLADTIHEFQNLVDLTSLIDREVFQH